MTTVALASIGSTAVRSPAELGVAAITLARRLAADVVVDDRGAPQWIGDEIDLAASPDGSVLKTGPVDDGFLTGRAGIALALAAAARHARDASLALLAQAAIADVLDARGTAQRRQLGWQSGDLGIAIAAERIADLLGRPDLAKAGRRLSAGAVAALATADDSRLPGYADLLDGSAGHLLAVLAAALPASAERHRAAAAERLVRDLRARAVVDICGARWPMADGDRAVTGLAHGSSGIGLALLAAHAAGVVGADRALADAAWTWEDAGYGAEDGGWYDLRVDEPAIGLAWCHGAPGIGIAAALRSRIDRDDALESEATYLRALRSIERARREFPDGQGDDATLCHGRSGIVELHLAGTEAAWSTDATSREEHLRAARYEASVIAAGIDADGSTTWSHGVRGGRSPAVLDGTAGVVLTLLRCAGPLASVAHPPLWLR
ncbi:lantibiotic modifying enzyme [Microbacterium trichothecenolyticum]|uniref:lanthionine synthetase LanC family protein n=1 Tax=Microbacterium trichothecenolyticum TaxID=69370 RepID=UPI0028606DB6|nr:lanthionine synthetase LanC family protein [Microbacterium trichothecenolyticum]MDR7183284.1 lantibiotic modifying enzyme [Microbacterium trichothecenolyticum]